MTRATQPLIDSVVSDPRRAFVLGSGVFTAVVAIAWTISGESLDSHWLSQLWIAVFFGLSMAGYSARQFDSTCHRWISSGAMAAMSVALVLIAYWSWPELVALVREDPLSLAIFLLITLVLFYHVILGASHMLVLIYLSHFIHSRAQSDRGGPS